MLFIFSLILSFSASCTNNAGNNAPVANNSGANNSVAKKANNEFPPVNSEIMQATLTNPDGREFKLDDYRGKIVLVNLWGIWCAPCRAEMPSLVELKEKYKDKNFEVIGLNVGDANAEKEAPAKIKEFTEKMGINYETAQGDEKVFSDFLKLSNYGGVPQSFLIDREGHLNGIFTGFGPTTPEKMNAAVKKIIDAD